MSNRPAPTPANSSWSSDASVLPPRLLAKLKVEIDGYEVLERLGEGGQATVYRAIQKLDGRMVAVKVLHAGPHATEEARARFKREINALRAINHPNIVHAIAAGRTRSGLDCLVMNFIDGEPLDVLWTDTAFASSVAPQPADLLRLFKIICETVQAAHLKGITHRDLSPSNILIDAKGQPHILDFGMASTAFDGIVTRNVTVTGQFIGKLKYASPEQARGAGSEGEGVDIRSDVYALGVMLYQLLTQGAFPYEVVGNVIDVLNNIIHSKPKPPSEMWHDLAESSQQGRAASTTPSELRRSQRTSPQSPVRRNPPLVNETIEAIVLKALEKDPTQRYQSAGELAADIDRYLAGQPTSAALNAKPVVDKPKSSSLRRAAITAASVVLVATVVGVSMNAKSLAVWLGLAAAAAPILPNNIAPVGTPSAEAGMLAASEPEDSLARLNESARELARVEARLVPVNSRLNRNASGAQSAKDFCEELAKASLAAGRELRFTLPTDEDLSSAKGAQHKTLDSLTDESGVLEIAHRLNAQQAGLWARIAWGTFTGRDEEMIYTHILKYGTDGSLDQQTLNTMIDKGVRLRMVAQIRMRESAAVLREIAQKEQIDQADITAVFAQLSDQVGTEVETFVNAAKSAGNLGQTAEAQVALAKEMRDTLATAGDKWKAFANAQDDFARSTGMKDLQAQLSQSGQVAAKFDDGLVTLAKELKIEADAAYRRSPIQPQRDNGDTGRDVASDESLTLLLAVGTTWELDNGEVATVQEVNGDEVIMFVSGGNAKNRTLRLRMEDDQIVLLSDSGREGYSIEKGLKVRGKIVGGKLNLAGTRTIVESGKPTEQPVTYIFVQKPVKEKVVVVREKPAVSNDDLAAWKIGSEWKDGHPGGAKDSTWEVKARSGNIIEIGRKAKRGNRDLIVAIRVGAKGVVEVEKMRYSDGGEIWSVGGNGTISSTSLKLSFTGTTKKLRGRGNSPVNETIDLHPLK